VLLDISLTGLFVAAGITMLFTAFAASAVQCQIK